MTKDDLRWSKFMTIIGAIIVIPIILFSNSIGFALGLITLFIFISSYLSDTKKYEDEQIKLEKQNDERIKKQALVDEWKAKIEKQDNEILEIKKRYASTLNDTYEMLYGKDYLSKYNMK